MSELVRLRITIDGNEVVTPSAVLSYDGCNAFHLGDTVNGARLDRRTWQVSGEGRFELTLECLSLATTILRDESAVTRFEPSLMSPPQSSPIGTGTVTVASVSAFPGSLGKKGKHGRHR
jgi:hypothetical protein